VTYQAPMKMIPAFDDDDGGDGDVVCPCIVCSILVCMLDHSQQFYVPCLQVHRLSLLVHIVDVHHLSTVSVVSARIRNAFVPWPAPRCFFGRHDD